MRIVTERLVLDALTAEDAEGFAALVGDPAVAPMLMVFPAPCPVDLAADVIAQSSDTSRLGFRLAIREGGALVGTVGIGGRIPGGPTSVMYAVAPAAAGRGVATEAMRGFLAACFAAFDLAEVTADRFEDNPASGAVLRRLGFEEVGRCMGASAARAAPAPNVLYRLTRAAWEAAA